MQDTTLKRCKKQFFLYFKLTFSYIILLHIAQFFVLCWKNLTASRWQLKTACLLFRCTLYFILIRFVGCERVSKNVLYGSVLFICVTDSTYVHELNKWMFLLFEQWKCQFNKNPSFIIFTPNPRKRQLTLLPD